MTDENEVPIPLSCDEERPIPSSWREHFGEEVFGDIWVYVNYGDRTPLEALGILGLEPPPEKRMEPEVKQEDSTVVEKIKVTTPEISIKEDKKEVKMEQQNVDGKNPFPNTNMDPVDKTGWNPSMQGQGLDEISLPREKTAIYGGKQAG